MYIHMFIYLHFFIYSFFSDLRCLLRFVNSNILIYIHAFNRFGLFRFFIVYMKRFALWRVYISTICNAYTHFYWIVSFLTLTHLLPLVRAYGPLRLSAGHTLLTVLLPALVQLLWENNMTGFIRRPWWRQDTIFYSFGSLAWSCKCLWG